MLHQLSVIHSILILLRELPSTDITTLIIILITILITILVIISSSSGGSSEVASLRVVSIRYTCAVTAHL
jgi:hypothetical protein